jgi:hypothetical protein
MSRLTTLAATAVALAVILVPATALEAQEPTRPEVGAPAPLFSSSEPLVITLEADFQALGKDRGDDRVEHAATLTYLDASGAPVSVPVDLRTRGNFRLKPSTCRFPPIRFDFLKKAMAGTVFEGQDKLKVVTHCQDRDSYEQYGLHEHIIYRIYNLVTDLSLRVRLARFTYVDTSGKDDPFTRYGFFIEDIDALAERAWMKATDTLNVHPATTEYRLTGVMDVFQYLIGNTDWSTYAQHNIKLLRDQHGRLHPVPYDFDWSGLMSTPYAKPNPRLDINTVRQRIYRGFCRPPEQFEIAFTPFREQRDAIYAIYDSVPDLEPKQLKRTIEYIDEFYEILDDPKKIDREFLKKCRQ